MRKAAREEHAEPTRFVCPGGGLMVKLLVVDDEALVRSGVRMILRAAGQIEVVGGCDGPEAMEVFLRHRPDVVLLDVRMPLLRVLTQLMQRPEPPAVGILTTFSGDEQVAAALERGAAGFMLKDSEPEDLVQAVRALAAGGRVLSLLVAGVVIDGCLGARPDADARALIAAVSGRGRRVLALVGAGLPDAAIGRRLHLSPATVKEHVGCMLARLGGVNRVQGR
jgi:DNA-binding NarL/FixJ family response regulator